MATPPQTLTTAPPQTLTADAPPQTLTADTGTSVPASSEGLMSGIVSGMLQGAGETAGGAAGLLEKATGGDADKQIIPAMQSPNVKGFSVPMRGTEGTPGSMEIGNQTSAGHTIGSGLETMGEFAAGEGLLSDFSKMLVKYPDVIALMEKYPKASKLLLEASKADTESKLAKIGATAAKSAVVGGTQGAVKAEGEGGSAAEGAAGGAVGGAAGGAVGEGASQILGDIMKQFGIGTEAAQKGLQSLKPSKGNIDFIDDFHKAAPVIDALPDWKNAKDAQQGVEAIQAARQNWWNQEVKPYIDKHENVPLNGINIATSIRNHIPETMRPAQKAFMESLAKDFESASPNLSMADPNSSQFYPVSNMPIGKAEQWIEQFNAELAESGFWKKSPSERAAALRTNGEQAGWKAAADAIRDELYNRIGILENAEGNHVDMADKKAMYGALRNVENQLQGRVNVEGRQAPISLKQAIGLAAGLSMGRLEGLAAITLPMVDRNYNSAIKLAQRGVKQAATGEEGPVAEAAKSAVENIPAIASPAGAAAGRIYFHSSDGGTHSIPNDPNAIKQAVQIDPHLQFVTPPQENTAETK